MARSNPGHFLFRITFFISYYLKAGFRSKVEACLKFGFTLYDRNQLNQVFRMLRHQLVPAIH